MNKLITKDQTIELKKHNLRPKDVLANDIRIEGDQYIDLMNLDLNIVNYELTNIINVSIHIKKCNINKLMLDVDRRNVRIFNSNIQNVYVQSEINLLRLENTPLPNFHGNISSINKIRIEQ